MQKNPTKEDQLLKESEILGLLKNDLIFPTIYYHNFNENGFLIIESLCGPSLDKLYKFCDFNFDIITISNIGIDIVSSLEILHKIGYIHLDIKEDNISILLKNNKNDKKCISCILLDFGKALKIPVEDNFHKKKEMKEYIGGNISNASINMMLCGNTSEKDDFESLMYLLIDLYLGGLPWNDFDKTDGVKYKKAVLQAKKEYDSELINDKNFELAEIYYYIRNMDENKKPDYPYIKSLFKKIIEKNGGPNINQNYRFKWENKFYYIMKNFVKNRNIQDLNYAKNHLFKGFPDKLVISFLNNYFD